MKTAARLAVFLAALTAARAEPSARLKSAELLRLGDDAVLRLNFERSTAPESVRVLLAPAAANADRAGNGATHLIDGLRFFARSPDPAPGGWDEIGAVAAVADGPSLALLIPRAAIAPRIRWAVEVRDDRWRIVARHPAAGWNETLLRSATEPVPRLDPAPDDFPVRAPRSLSQRFRDLDGGRAWAPRPPPASDGTFRLLLRERESGQYALAEAETVEQCGDAVRLKGAHRGIRWTLRISPDDGGETIEGEFEADDERALTVRIERLLPAGEWTWHDDLDSARRIAPGAGARRNVAPTPFGAGAQSRYPIGVVAGPAGEIVTLEVPPDEPRLFRIEAEDGPPRLGAEFDLGLTPHTLEFPLRATVALRRRQLAGPAADAFRVAWADFQHRHAPLFERRRPEAGFWLPDPEPVADVAELSPLWGLAAPARDQWLALRPFQAAWPVDVAAPPDPAEVLRRLRFYAAFDRGWTGLDARAALLAGARNADGSPAFTITSGRAVAEVNANPAFLTPPSHPMNRAMTVWAMAVASRAAAESVGTLIEGIGGLSALDFNRAALAAARHPATWRAGTPGVGLAGPLAAMELLPPLATALLAENILLAVDLTGVPYPFFSGPADLTLGVLPAPGAPGADTEWNARRALAGPKTAIALFDADFEQWSPADRRAFFDACLFHGMIHAPRYSTDGRSYWSQPGWLDRDRATFRTYGPWIRRLAEAGWTPDRAASTTTPGWRMEQFGSGPTLLLTLRRNTAAPAEALVRVPLTEKAVVLDPLSGACEPIWPAGGSAAFHVRVPPAATALRIVAPWSATATEAAFLKNWTSGEGEAAAAAINLRACAAESDAAIVTEIRVVERRFHFRLINRGDATAIISDARWSQGASMRSFAADPRILAAGESVEFSGELPDRAGAERAWTEVRWRCQRGARSWDVSRAFRPTDLAIAP